MRQSSQTVQAMARATSLGDIDAVRRLLESKPDLSQCLDGWNRNSGFSPEDYVILKLLLDDGADINDISFEEPLLHSIVDALLDCQGARYGTEIDWVEVGKMINLGADPFLVDGHGRTIFDMAQSWGERDSLKAYLRSIGIPIE